MTRFREFDRIQLLARLLQEQAGQLVTDENLGRRVQVSGPSIKQWIKTLEALYFCFSVKPWSGNINRALTKEPKYYPFDWASVEDPGARAETFVAMHLLKAVDYWTDAGMGTFALHFVRDREKREVDFLIVKDRQPWMLVEVKVRPNKGVSRHLHCFAQRLKPAYALQVVLDMNYVDRNCFVGPAPIVVPARTFLSQLL